MLYFSPLDKSWPRTLTRATGGVVDLQRNVHHKTDVGQRAVGTTHERFTCRGGREGEEKIGKESGRGGERVSREEVLLVERNLYTCTYRFPQISLTIHKTEEEHFESVGIVDGYPSSKDCVLLSLSGHTQ